MVAEHNFTCKHCRQPLAKMRCEKHMKRKHGIDAKGWLCCTDGKTIENRRRRGQEVPPCKLFLTSALEDLTMSSRRALTAGGAPRSSAMASGGAEQLSAQSLVAEPAASEQEATKAGGASN